jgi:hypothetical protein
MKYVIGAAGVAAVLGGAAWYYLTQMDAAPAESVEEPAPEATPETNI